MVKTINGHRFFHAEENEYVSIGMENVDSLLGQHFIKAQKDGYAAVKLVDYKVTEEFSGCYSIMTAGHYNFFVEGMLSDTFHPGDAPLFDYFKVGEGLKFDEAQMRADIETYGLYTYDQFADYLTYEQFMAFGVPYMKISVEKGLFTYEGILDLINTYVK